MFNRKLESTLRSNLNKNKVLILIGPRQVGKTTLLRDLTHNFEGNSLWWNGDEPDIREDVRNATSSYLKSQLNNVHLLVIDEAQRIENIGITLKLLHESIPSLKVIASGSSSFDLANTLNEPLTGRKIEMNMFPLSVQELVKHEGKREFQRLLKNRLIYGSYPEVLNNPGMEREILRSLSDSYLYKDILSWENVQKPAKLEKLLQALALQIGSEISVNELSQITGLDNHTVDRYINLLEKSFVIFQLHPFSRNLRNEIKKSRKIYFVDNGIRNAIINQFATVDLRTDIGALWENFVISERRKLIAYTPKYCSPFFWRNHAGQEIDYLEEQDGQIDAYECKWNPKARYRFTTSFTNEYQPRSKKVVNNESYFEFLTSI